MKHESEAIFFDKVSVRRGHKNALTRLSFRIHIGEHAAILGPNGSGKSTLIKTIARELYPTEGTVRLFGKEIWDVFELRSRLGIVSYDTQALFNQGITGREAVLSGFFSSVGLWKNNRVTPEMERKADNAIRWLGLTKLQKKTFPHLSSGESRRFLIARALIHNPDLIVFDEPLNSLDLTAQSLVKQALRKLANAGIGVVLVTHHLPDIIPEIGRVLLLKEGRLVEDGSKKAVLTPKNMKKIFGVDLRLLEKDGYFHAL